jgi:protein SCO1/2
MGCLAGFVALSAALILIVEMTRSPVLNTPIGGPFELVDQDGRTVTDATYRGKWLLIYFGYTHCPDACPTALNDMAEALDATGALGRKVQPLFITVDPGDTPGMLKPYTASFGPTIVGLTGSPEQIDRVAKEYHIVFRHEHAADGTDTIEHSSAMFLIGPDGRFVAKFPNDATSTAITAKLRATVS